MNKKIFYVMLALVMCACGTQTTKEDNNNVEGTNQIDSVTCTKPDSITIDTTSAVVSQKKPDSKKAIEQNNVIAVKFMGYFKDYARLKSSNNYIKASKVFPEIASREDFSVKTDGEEVYLIIAKFDSAKVSINELTFDMLLNGQDESDGKVLFEGEANTPYLIKCNVSDTHSDINIHVEYGNGEIINYSPRLSLQDGSVITSQTGIQEIIFK